MNVFADIDLPDAEERMAKAELTIRISRAIRARGMTQVEAARALGISRDETGRILRGQLVGFSSEQLRRILKVIAPL